MGERLMFQGTFWRYGLWAKIY